MRLLHVLPPAERDRLDQPYYAAARAAVLLSQAADAAGLKLAGDTVTTHALSGKLYLSNSGWLLMQVPNALVRGAFDALNETGVELPLKDGILNAHVSVMRKEEVEQIGADKISERGHSFPYTLGPVKTVVPHGWSEMSRVWMIEIQSPALKALRKSYGLTPLPNGDFQFHCTIAVRRKHVLKPNDVSKAAALKIQRPFTQTNGGRFTPSSRATRVKAPTVLEQLRQAKAESDRRNYAAKHAILRQLMTELPGEFITDSQTPTLAGITHQPSGMQFHMPRTAVPS